MLQVFWAYQKTENPGLKTQKNAKKESQSAWKHWLSLHLSSNDSLILQKHANVSPTLSFDRKVLHLGNSSRYRCSSSFNNPISSFSLSLHKSHAFVIYSLGIDFSSFIIKSVYLSFDYYIWLIVIVCIWIYFIKLRFNAILHLAISLKPV